MDKAVCHFSCGSTSAVATYLMLKEYGPKNVDIIYADPGAEHPDNMRFLKECEEKLFKKKVTILRSKKYKHIREVFEDRRFLASPAGAPCTTEMKKIPIRDYLGFRLHEEVQILGFDYSDKEIKRLERWKQNNPDVVVRAPLIEQKLTKKYCLEFIDKREIKLPEMYLLGFPNANCVGCVKAENLSYWALIRDKFPEDFKWYAEFERKIGAKDENGVPRGAAINKRYIKGERHRLFLDELPESQKIRGMIPDFHCGYSCGAQEGMEEQLDLELEDVGNCED